MKNIEIPKTAESYQSDIAERAFPDREIADNDFYRRLIGWVVDNKTPLLYEPTHPDEVPNLSINFNWLLLKDYEDSKIGQPDTIKTMYALHEFTHMTNWLPTRLDEISADEYADQFTRSEYRASNESEILLHYRVPELRPRVLQGMTIAADILKRMGIGQPSSALLGKVRPLLIEHDDFDGLAGDDPDAKAEIARMKQFSGNHEWAREHFKLIRPLFQDASLPLGTGLIDTEYEAVISNYEPNLSQDQYEANVIENVRLAYCMCGLGVVALKSFKDALAAAGELEGRDALVRS
jgi:hypothetical protein